MAHGDGRVAKPPPGSKLWADVAGRKGAWKRGSLARWAAWLVLGHRAIGVSCLGPVSRPREGGVRVAVAFIVLGLGQAGCRCSPTDATPVTLRLRNSTRGPIFVDDLDGGFGLQVQRQVQGQWLSFVEHPACACLACDVVCQGCACGGDSPVPLVRTVAAGLSLERTWDGTVQVSRTAGCSGAFVAGPACLDPEVPPVDEQFRVRLCYSPEAPGIELGDGGAVPGILPAASVICVTREFRPEDGVVEVGPSRGVDCATHGDCKVPGQLCFDGACTSACPASGFPEVGASWEVRVQEPDDQGFFDVRSVDAGTRYTGVGAIGSVLYENGTLTLRLNRSAAGGGALTGAVYVTLPSGYSVAMTPGPKVSVLVVDSSTSAAPENRAITVRELDGGLIFAADSAQNGALLSAADTAPFSVAAVPTIVACQNDDCGKRRYFGTVFSGGTQPVTLDPGKGAQVAAAGAGYTVLNVTDYSYASGTCRPAALAPYAILRAGP